MNTLLKDIAWLEETITCRFSIPMVHPLPKAPVFEDDESYYYNFIQEHDLTEEERLLLLLCLLPSIDPLAMQQLFNQETYQRPEAGLITGKNYKGHIPSGMTYVFLLAGNERAERLKVYHTVLSSSLVIEGIVTFIQEQTGEPFLNSPISLELSFLKQILGNLIIDLYE